MGAPDIAVIDPGMGNLFSVLKAFEHVGAKCRLAASPDAVGRADALILPGQGGMGHCMKALVDSGFDLFLKNWIERDAPFFGICLGLQALFEYSEEGDIRGLGILPGHVRKFKLDSSYKIPHMGWNEVAFCKSTSLQSGIDLLKDQFYFVHSYHVDTPASDLVWAETVYGYRFVSAVNRGRCFATQFHPEKSQGLGLRLYRNFIQSL